MSEFTPEQFAILEEADSHFVVLASAGAGKTRMLVERYLKHVVTEGLNPGQILTITFTKKAAGEMKHRIVQELRRAGKVVEAQAAETGPIQTIDSFCERLLREQAVEAGVDPNFESLGDGARDHLLDQALRSALAEVASEHLEARTLIGSLASKPSQEGWYAQIGQDVRSVLGKLRGTNLDPEELLRLYEDPAATVDRAHALIWSVLPEPVRSAPRPPAAPGPAFVKACRASARELGVRLPTWLNSCEEADREFAQTCGFMQIAIQTWLRFEQLMNAQQAFDYNGVTSRAIRVLEQSGVARRRVRAKYTVLLVDEFQDVNQAQNRLIDALGIDRTMKVGDPQQSIYGFRQADPRIMERAVETTRTLRLSRNHRSVPGILRFVDNLFGRLQGDRYQPMLHEPDLPGFEPVEMFEGVEYWSVDREEHADHRMTGLRLWSLHREGVPWSDIAILVRHRLAGQSLALALQSLEIPYRTGGNFESIYTRMEVRDLANALLALVDPRDDFALLAMLRSPIVGLSLDAVALLAAGRRVIDALGTFESPIDDDREKLEHFLAWFEPLAAFADRLTAWELIAEVIRSSRLLATLAERPNAFETIANVRKLLALATEEPDVDPRSYADQIRSLQKLNQASESSAPRLADEQAVTIMTMHAAKGLEFPCVVLADLSVAPWKGSRAPISDMDSGLVATKYTGTCSELFTFLSKRDENREKAEALRVLYVAVTRAKQRLCLVVDPDADRESPSAIILDNMGAAPPGVRLRDVTPHLKVSH